jgi:hypothetical protein
LRKQTTVAARARPRGDDRGERHFERAIAGHARGDQLRVVLCDMLRELGDDVGLARRVDGQRREACAHESFEVRHDQCVRRD